jgi:formamidopyrimidine-DNA glycosylase
MPELPEVEVLVRHLRPALENQTIQGVLVRRERVIAGTTLRKFSRALMGSTITGLSRRGKYLLFSLCKANPTEQFTLLGHLGMTGRMYVSRPETPLPKHAAVILDLGPEKFVFEDTRYFGRLTLDTAPLEKLGPEPLEAEFTPEDFAKGLKRSSQAIKIKLLDQALIAGLGNIYASEALFRAGISPRIAARRLGRPQIVRLCQAIRQVLAEAIEFGSTVPLNYSGADAPDRLFYSGSNAPSSDFYEERLHVYDRAGRPCINFGRSIKRLVQAARSTFYCPACQQ